MPRRRQKELIACQYFSWLLGRRGNDGVFYADGRSNAVNLGRHSLGSKDRDVATIALKQLDLSVAIKLGRAEPTALSAGSNRELLSLPEGVKIYMAHVERSRIFGGARPATVKRYRAVFDKFKAHASSRGVTCWEQVNARLLEGYGNYLVAEKYAYRSQYLELTTVKQAMNWLIKEKRVPEACRFEIP
jgi:hypothetical protein